MSYILEMRDGVSTETEILDEEPSTEECDEMTTDWVRGGDWGVDGARISAWWTLSIGVDPNDSEDETEEISEGRVEVDIEPDRDAMIRAAGGDPDCDHAWTSEGEGGCDSNPGVWSTGGTGMAFRTRCRLCGLRRLECITGSQRNPGEVDTTTYEQPDSWCAECESEDCSCEPAEVDD